MDEDAQSRRRGSSQWQDLRLHDDLHPSWRNAIKWHPDTDTYICPRHGANFDIDGNVTKGPARTPLIRYAISVDANGHLIVDKSQSFTSDQWDNPASFVKV